MNKKIAFGTVIGLVCVAIVLTGLITVTIMNGQYNKLLKGLPEKLERYEVLDELDGIIKNNYYGGSDAEAIKKALVKGYVLGLPDGYSRYLSSSEYKEYVSEADGDMLGIGIDYSKTGKSQIEIEYVYDGSPAQSAGLEVGDIIIAFDGIMLNASNYDEMAAKLEGDKLSSLNITYKRGKNEETINVAKGYEAKSVSTKTYGNAGYIKITDFYSTTASQVQSAVDSFVSSGIGAIVIDLRKNSSTSFKTSMDTLDIFVPMNESSLAASTLVDKAGNVIEKYSTESGEVSVPIAILISSGTQAAAEIFACNMRDFGKASLVGTSTKGNTLVQEAFKLSTGDAVLLSVGEMLPYKSGSFNKKGLEPDLVSELREKTSKLEADSQFQDALNLILPQ